MEWKQSIVHALDAARWAEDRLGFRADTTQKLVLDTAIRRGLLNCSRQWGKSTVTAVKALHRAVHEPGVTVVAASPSARQSGLFVDKVCDLVRALGEQPRGDGRNEISVMLKNRSRIVGLPGNETTVRGFSAVRLLVVDEAARVSDELYKALRPMLAAGNGDLWLMSTPNGKRGFFHQEWENGGAGWTRVQVTAEECSRIRPEFLEEERRSLGDAWFRQEYLCEFVQSDDAVFREEDVLACVGGEAKPLFPDHAGAGR